MLVFDTESGAIAASVDCISSVSVIPPENIEARPNIILAVPSKFILGIGKIDDRMVTLIDLNSVLSAEDLVSLGTLKVGSKVS